MVACLQEELSEDVKVALAAALAAWLPRCGGMPEPALARIAGGLLVSLLQCSGRQCCALAVRVAAGAGVTAGG